MKKVRNFLLIVLCMVLVSALSIGGTIAYLTDTDGDANVMVVGNVMIEQNEQDRNGNDFVQGQYLLPLVGSAAIKDANGYPNAANYLDKIVTVTNTGKNDAWVRTIIAIPAIDYDGKADNDASANVIHWNGYSVGDAAPDYPAATRIPGTDKNVANNWYWGQEGKGAWPGNGGDWNLFDNVTISGKEYAVYVVTNIVPVKPGQTTAPNMIGFYLDSMVDFDGDNYTINGKKITGLDATADILVLSQAVQSAGFDTPWVAFDTAFGKVDANTLSTWFAALTSVPEEVDNDAALKNALTADEKNITVVLNDDVTYDVAAWAANGMGGENTENITIIGNGHTITFHQTDSDWNNIVTNGATLTIIDAHITNSGHNDGPWNRHDLNFNCNVELSNVTSDKALAFKQGAKLYNVTVNDANNADTYAIWIQPNGQTVTLDGCTIDMLDCTDGRGIKIDEQYVSNPAKVTLKVSNTTFKTEEKSAILVKSVAGADVILNNVDISGVAADSTNAVWVDEASTAYADLVTVTGGNKIVEP